VGEEERQGERRTKEGRENREDREREERRKGDRKGRKGKGKQRKWERIGKTGSRKRLEGKRCWTWKTYCTGYLVLCFKAREGLS
jgi:hypothetical protein